MEDAASLRGTPTKQKRGLPKIHLIYFLLAMFDLIAVMGGLYLSSRLSSLIEHSVEENRIWDSRIGDVYRVGTLIGPISKSVNESFDFLAVTAAKTKSDYAFQVAESRLKALSDQFAKSLDPSQAETVLQKLASVRDSLTKARETADVLFASHTSGDSVTAARYLSRFNQSLWVVDKRLELAVQSIRSIRESISKDYVAKAEFLKRYEYLIGVGIIFMVVCVVLYGHSIGSILRTKYRELEKAHDDLDAALVESRMQAGQLAVINDDVSRLNRELSDNMAKLRDAQDEIIRKGKMSQLGQLTATVAHELRNPLAAVRTAAFLVERKAKNNGLEIEKPLTCIKNGIGRCDDIIGQLLDFSRVRSVTRELRPFDAWILGVLEEEADRMPQAVTLEFDQGCGEARASFDPDRLRRALINLLSNASEAMVGRGNDPSKFSTSNPRINLTSRLTHRGFEIEVSDNGPGIPPEHLDKVRNPLFTTKSFGTGLGIPAVEQIAQLHGGGLDIVSALGQGASFTVWIPELHEVREVA